MNKADIEQILDNCNRKIDELSDQAKTGQIDKVILKNTLENMRSILDYHAQDIKNQIKKKSPGEKSPDKIYFPYGQKENHFKNSIKINLPQLKTVMPDVYDLIEKIQPFKLKDNWLVDLCFLTNEAKHNNLTRTNLQKSVSVKQGNFVNITGHNNIFFNNHVDGNRLDDVFVNNDGSAIVMEHSGGTEITVNNTIKFHGKELEVVPFLKDCQSNLETFSNKLFKFLYSDTEQESS